MSIHSPIDLACALPETPESEKGSVYVAGMNSQIDRTKSKRTKVKKKRKEEKKKKKKKKKKEREEGGGGGRLRCDG